ncbi:hypothetical protein K0M31_017155, partial [Melipona bicolor]
QPKIEEAKGKGKARRATFTEVEGFLVERGEARERPNTLGEDPIEEYRPLPVFVSDQIGGWLLVVSLEYILISGDPSRGTFAE